MEGQVDSQIIRQTVYQASLSGRDSVSCSFLLQPGNSAVMLLGTATLTSGRSRES